MTNIPLIIPNFQQLSYLRNLVNQFHFYYPENKIYVLDNGSDYNPLLDYYWKNEDFTVFKYQENDFVKNLKSFLRDFDSEYYVISDPDISIHPTTPPNFLEIFKAIIDSGVHHVGFDLIYDDIPSWNKKAGWIQGDEKELHKTLFDFKYEPNIYHGFKAAVDTTFAMYKKNYGGWSAPMSSLEWSNSVRMFKAFHMGWYLHPDYTNEEMKNYFATCKRFEPGMVSAGRNNFRPE